MPSPREELTIAAAATAISHFLLPPVLALPTIALTIHHVERKREEGGPPGSSTFPGESPSSQLTETGLTGEPDRPT